MKIDKRIYDSLKENSPDDDFFELVAVELHDDTILNNVILRNSRIKIRNDKNEKAINDDDFIKEEDNHHFFNYENYVGKGFVKRIFESPNLTPEKVYFALGDRVSEDYMIDEHGNLTLSCYIFTTKMKDGEYFNFKIDLTHDYNYFLSLPKNYSFNDIVEILKDKWYYNGELYSFRDNLIMNNLDKIKIYEKPYYFICYIDLEKDL